MTDRTFRNLYGWLLAYKAEYGNLSIPRNYENKNGIKLGNYIGYIRSKQVIVSEEQCQKLEEIGFVWKVNERRSFSEWYEMLKDYKMQHGHLLVPSNYVTQEKAKLGAYVANVRSGRITLNDTQRQMLNNLTFVWKCRSKRTFNDWYKLLKEYKKEHGNLLVPQKYITENGVKLGQYVNSIRFRASNLTREEHRLLDEIGFAWSFRTKRTFYEWYNLLIDYKREYKHLDVPARYVTADGGKLGSYVRNIRNDRVKITKEQIARLNSIGFIWKK